MNYDIRFKCMETGTGNTILQQEFEVDYPYEFYQSREHLIIDIDYSLICFDDGITYYNSYGRTDKFEIIFQIKARGSWHEYIYAKSASISEFYSFDISQFIINNQLHYLEDFKVFFVIIGDNTELTVNSLSLRNEMDIKEYYKITNLDSGYVSDWILFDSSTISKMNELDYLCNRFTLEYKVIDPASNEAITSIYNGGYDNILYSTETSLTWTDDSIDLNSASSSERTLTFTADFGGIPNLDVFINGFLYGTQAVNIGGNDYEVSFGTSNDYNTLLTYSQSLLSESIFSNINPLNHISWEIEDDNYFGVVKHVLIDNNIIIINPLTHNTTILMELGNLYDRGLILPDFVRIKEVYFFNTTLNNSRTSLSFGEYVVNNTGHVSWPDESRIHDIYTNHFDDVKDGIVYFEYYASDFSSELGLTNADGFIIDFIMPSVYWTHTTIEKLIISFNDFLGNSFVKTFFDLDLKKYFMDDVKSNYEQEIFGLGKVMVIPLYINIKELMFSNPDKIFQLNLLDSISFTITDSALWPGSFIQDYGQEGYDVLNLPYQRVGVQDIRLFNLISDSIEEESGFVDSTIELRAPDYYDFYTTDQFNIKRIDTTLTDIAVFFEGQEITSLTDVQYSDYIEVYMKQGGILSPILFDELFDIPISLFDSINSEALSVSDLFWITKDNRFSPDGYTIKYYYAKFEVPKFIKLFSGLTLSSIGTPVQNIIFSSPPTFDLNIVQETLSDSDSGAIYLSEYESRLEYQNSLVLEGVILDDDEYIIEDKLYDYHYLEAADGTTVHNLDIIAPLEEDSFIDKEQFSIFYLNDQLERVPLYIHQYKGTELKHVKDNSILGQSRDPRINYIDNAYLLTIYWNPDSANFISYDTSLLISYKVIEGRPISPLSYSSFDTYDHSKDEHLVEIPFAKYDMIDNQWVTEDDSTEIFPIDKILEIYDTDSTSIPVSINGPTYSDGGTFNLGIIGLENIYIKPAGEVIYQLVDSADYSWNIDSSGMLSVTSYTGPAGDLKIAYYTYGPVVLQHSLTKPESVLTHIKVISREDPSNYHIFDPSEYKISTNGYKVYFYDLYNTVVSPGTLDLYDIFEIRYHAPLTKRIDLSSNLLLMLQDSSSTEYVPIDTVSIDNLGLYKYEGRFSIDSPLSLPMAGETVVNMRLDYLPAQVYDVSQTSLINIQYSGYPTIDYIYPYTECIDWTKPFSIITVPKRTKLEMIDYTTQSMVVSQEFIEDREYIFNTNPLESIEEGEEYTAIQLDVLTRENYEFSFKLTDYQDSPINNSIIWMQMGFMPKSESKFLNDRAIIEELGSYPYFESLGTELITSEGPGTGPNKMFGRPLTYQTKDTTSYYGPYIWDYMVTNEYGEVTFEVSFDHDYLLDFVKIFNSLSSIQSVEDIVMYIRVISSIFDWNEFKIDNPEQYICSQNGTVYDGSTSIDTYDFTELAIQDSAYIEGIVRFQKGDIALGLNDYLSYDLPNPDLEGEDPDYEDVQFTLHVTEADPIPSVVSQTLESLANVYTSSELEPLPINILEGDSTYSISLDVIDISGNNVLHSEYPITPVGDAGTITITGDVMKNVIQALPPGVNSISFQVIESNYYKASPIVSIPLEIKPPNWIRFGEKNSKIDLIDPFISAYGSAFSGEDLMIFESNYPHLIGTLWINPDFNGPVGEEERSIQDYIEISLDATIYNNDGTISEFPLREAIMLRPVNHEGLMTLSVGFGPEDAFLMGQECALTLSFDASYNEYDLEQQARSIEIILLDLHLEENPSSSTPDELWSLFNNQFDDASGIVITEDPSVTTDVGTLMLGDDIDKWGVQIDYVYDSAESVYSLDSERELLNLLNLVDIDGVALYGQLNKEDHEFVLGSDWVNLAEPSSIEFLGTPGNTPDDGSEFTVIYKFDFSFNDQPGEEEYYGKVTLDSSTLQSSIEFYFADGILEPSSDSKSSMFTPYTESCNGETIDYPLSYSVTTPQLSDFVIYNYEELDALDVSFGQPDDKSVQQTIDNGYLKITFSGIPDTAFTVEYGVKSQYALGYGFQEQDQSYSDSVRLMYNDPARNTNPIIDSVGAKQSISLKDPSLYISLGDSNIETVLELYSIPLLFAPEVNFTFKLDEVVLDQIKDATEFNTLKMEFYYVIDEGYNSYMYDSVELLLDYTNEIEPFLETDDSYIIYYNKDLQGLYEASVDGNLDVYISISQVGDGQDYLSYIILEEFDYLTDEHLVEMYDSMPLDNEGNLDVNSVVHTPHYFQIFSKPFKDGVYDIYTPFDLVEDSTVTVSLEDLPYSYLVALQVDAQQNYDFDYLGSSETIPVTSEEFYMIRNLALFTDAYNLEEPVIQDGSVNLYYGSGTNVLGSGDNSKEFDMSGPSNYWSEISGEAATSWQNTFTFSDHFLTTNEIAVSGTVYYHQLFDLDSTEDIILYTEINDLFVDSGIENIQFGIQLSDDISIVSIKSVGEPFTYELSVQGFPTGNYIDTNIYYQVSTDNSIDYSPSSNILEYSTHYSLEYLSNGSKYLLFYVDQTFVGDYADSENMIMVDYWAFHTFAEGIDYQISENPQDPFASDIIWFYTYTDTPSLQFAMHPDFTLDSNFTIDYSALQWNMASVDEAQYIKDAIDTVNFQPRVKTNISVFYDGQDDQLFSILYTVPEDEFFEPDLFNYIYICTWDGSDESTRTITRLDYNPLYIIQDAQTEFLYTIDFVAINNDISPDEIYPDSYVFIETEFESDQLKYSLSKTPFNYDYLSTDPQYNQYHITIDINDGQIVYSSYQQGQEEFPKYVSKIENNYIYFKEGSINPESTIEVSYKYKLQPGLLEEKHFLMVIYPWSNVFEPVFEDVVLDVSSDSIEYREEYRKLAGGAVMTPFEYSLSIDDKYSLYISYRLNYREYYEDKFILTAQNYIDEDFEFSYLTAEFDNYIDELVVNDEAAVSVFYYDLSGVFKFLDSRFYSVDYNTHTITLIPDIHGGYDKNALTAHNDIDVFYISIVPKTFDVEYGTYKFAYDPRENKITDTVNVVNWDIPQKDGLDVYPNLDAYYFVDDDTSTYDNFDCYASQIAAYLGDGDTLRFDIYEEFIDNGNFDQLLTDFGDNGFLSLFVDANIQNYDSLESITINFLDGPQEPQILSSLPPISLEELIMNDFEFTIDISSGMDNVQYIEFKPTFRTDEVYNSDNTIGIAEFEYLVWNEELTFYDEDGNKFMKYPLQKSLKTDLTPIAYLFNEALEYLEIPAGLDFDWEVNTNEYTQLDEYTLLIPNTYLNPEAPTEELEFIDGDTIVLRYNTEVKKGIGIGIGKLYFQRKPHGYISSMPSAECLLVDISDYEDYTTYTNPYYYQISLELTPFNTEFTGSFKDVKIEFDLNDGQIDPQYIVDNLVEFTDMILSSPYPNYELTINEMIVQRISDEPTTLTEYLDERVWQFTEFEEFTSDDDPSDDTYTLLREKNPLFWGDDKWLEYVMIYDENYNYYGATVQTSEVDHQLHYVSSSDYFVWNNNFDQFQEYYGTQIQLPLMVDPNTNLYFTYSTSTSWQTPVLLDYGDIDTSTLDIIFNYDYLLTPRYEFWGDTVYENSVYDYDVAQYYSETFTVYSASAGSDYTHQFEVDDYSFENDFTNLQLFKVIGLKPTMEDVEIIDDVNYDIIFDIANKEIRIIVLAGEDLTTFDLITVMLSFSYGPISTFSEIQLSQSFHDDFISDAEATFYDYLSISFDYSILSGEYLFDENSQAITSDATSFEYIPFNRNPAISTDNKLNDEDAEMHIGFEIFYDPFNVIYEADIDMDGIVDYKQEIDVDKDGRIDIIKYGVEDSEDPNNIIWYTIIQDFYSEEVIVDKTIEEEKRTEWFDINDRAFSDYEWNILLLIISILVLPLLLYTLSTMMLPDVDYWAQKSLKQEVVETQFVKSHYYSIRLDEDQDGYCDNQITYEKSNTVVKYESTDYEKTIIAAKPQNVFSFLGEWIAKNVKSLLGKPPEDRVFNDKLTEEKLDSGDLSHLKSDYLKSILSATYRKFTKNSTITYTSQFIQEKITVTDWANGTIEQTRIYQDIFDNNDAGSDVIDSLSGAIYTIEDTETGQIHSVSSDSERLSITEPEEQQWDHETWEENIPIRFDSLTTIGSDGTTSTHNIYEEIITIEIPSRFNLYDDLYSNNQDRAVQDSTFTITGILVTPHDGMVYHTSDKDLFKAGKAKTPGKYFYYDSNGDNFFETVYILEPSRGKPVYIVKAIAYNYDGIHDVSPYRRVNRAVKSKTDFNQLAAESPQKFGAFWKVNFKKLERIDLLFPSDPFDGYEPKDHIFDISKLVNPSVFNSKFSELFYEARHRSYDDAWEIYKGQLEQDIVEQVFMTLTATIISATIHALTKWIPWISEALGQALGTAAYLATYTLLTKFFMDMKRYKADAIEKANTYIPVSMDDIKPISLNERSLATHGFWEDSMIATLMGHPNAYYTTVQGAVGDQLYTAQAIASPANILRYADDSASSYGFLAFLWNNLWKMAGSDPDLMVSLDFDNLNLDYFLMTTELPSLNNNPDYTFTASINNGLYYTYRENTIGYLQQAIAEETGGELSLIKPIIIDGRPEYIFVDGADQFNILTMPASHLYQPLIVSKEVAERVQLKGIISVNVKCGYSYNTKGISHHTSYPERELYPSKVPLSTHGFEYPITSIKIELLEKTSTVGLRVVDSITMTSESEGFDDFYHVEFGNIYFTEDFDTLVIANRQEYNTLINEGKLSATSKKYYRLTLTFDMIVADSSSEEHTQMALIQASAYAIMDYMNQYTFAKTSAEMIGEIAYTETLTLISSAISASAIYFGSWAVAGLKTLITEGGKALAKQVMAMSWKTVLLGIGQLVTGVVVGSIKEMFEEIIIDGFLETWGEKAIKMIGGNEEMAFWFTTLLTSGRESVGGLRSTIMKTLGKSSKLGGIRTWLSERLAINPNSDNHFRNEIIEEINNQKDENGKEKKDRDKIEKIKSWKQLAAAGLLGIITSIIPALFTGGLFLGSFSSMGIVSKIEGLSGQILGRYATLLNIDKMVGGDPKNLRFLHEALKLRSIKPDIDSSDISRKHIEENGVPITPVDISVVFNTNFMKELPTSPAHPDFLSKTTTTLMKAKQSRIENNQKSLEKLGGKVSEEFNDVLDQFDSFELRKLEEGLESYKDLYYNEHKVFVKAGPYGGVAWIVQEMIFDKIAKGETLTALESWIVDEGARLMGGYPSHLLVHPALYDRGTWEPGASSPYYPHFRRFIKILGNKLVRLGLVSTWGGNPSLSAISRLVGADLSVKRAMLKKGNVEGGQWDINEASLAKWYIKIEGKILASNRIHDKIGAINDINEFFDHYYLIFGYQVNHPLYRDAHLMVHRIAEVLATSNPEVITSNDVSKVENQLLDGSDCRHYYESIRSGTTVIPRIESINDLHERIETALDRKFPQIKDELMVEIDSIIQVYKDKIIQFAKGRDLLEGTEESIRKNLIQSIIDNNEVLQGIRDKTKLSELLFGRDSYLDYTFLSQKKEKDGTLSIHSRPEMYVLFRIIFHTSMLTTLKFREITGISIDSVSLLAMKKNIKNLIDKFIFSNPYSQHHYISESPRRGIKILNKAAYPDFLKPEYTLAQSVWLAFYVHESNPDLSFTGIENILDTGSDFTKKLSSGNYQFSVNTLKSLINKLNEFITDESALNPTSQKLAIYRMALNDITDYARERDISFIKFKNPVWYDKQWFIDSVRGYHIATLLGRNLGFDILTFKTLDDSIFVYGLDENGNTYARHHFRDDPDRKASLYAEDLVLTDLFTHTYYEYHLTEADIFVILNGFDTMMRTEGSGPNGYITINDLEHIFEGNDWVLDKWRENPDFIQNLREFNIRNKYYNTNGMEAFIQQYYSIAHERFFEHADGDGIYSMLVRCPGFADYSIYNLQNIDFREIYEDL